MTTLANPAQDTCSTFAALAAYLRESAVLGSIGAVLGWDQETYLPRAGAQLRADQGKYLAGLGHARATSSELCDLIEACEADSSVADNPETAAALRDIRRDYDHATKLPADLVADISEAGTLGMMTWREARANSSFEQFLPALERTVELNRRKAECLGIGEGRTHYDTLLDIYEPGMTSAQVKDLFAPLRAFTVEAVERVRSSTTGPSGSTTTINSTIESQRRLCNWVMEQAGFNFEAGRFDETAHPFCSGFGPGDTRLTNRYRVDGWTDSLACALHEGGHGLYEQGLRKTEFFGLPLAEAVSLGIHESQSRLWENQLGRSREFVSWLLPNLPAHLGSAFEGLSVDDVHRDLNMVQPSLIRVESDEVTYNLHIMLRFDMERGMINGEIAPKDLPSLWNERMKNDLGVDVPDDARGCLQDVHWSMTAMGYFPTYTLGNMYAATWWAKLDEAIADRDQLIANGDFAAVLQWTRENIHAHGKRYRAQELCERITGAPLSPQPLIDYLDAKVKATYSV